MTDETGAVGEPEGDDSEVDAREVVGDVPPELTEGDFHQLARQAQTLAARVAALVAQRDQELNARIAVEGIVEDDLPPSHVAEIRQRRQARVGAKLAPDLNAMEGAAYDLWRAIEAQAPRHTPARYLRDASVSPGAQAAAQRLARASGPELVRFAEDAASRGDLPLAAALDGELRSRADLSPATREQVRVLIGRVPIPARERAQAAAEPARAAAWKAIDTVLKQRPAPDTPIKRLAWARKLDRPVWD